MHEHSEKRHSQEISGNQDSTQQEEADDEKKDNRRSDFIIIDYLTRHYSLTLNVNELIKEIDKKKNEVLPKIKNEFIAIQEKSSSKSTWDTIIKETDTVIAMKPSESIKNYMQIFSQTLRNNVIIALPPNLLTYQDELSSIAKLEDTVHLGSEGLEELKEAIGTIVSKSKDQISMSNKSYEEDKENAAEKINDVLSLVNMPDKINSLLESKNSSNYKPLIAELTEAKNSLMNAAGQFNQWKKTPIVVEDKEIPLEQTIMTQYPQEVEAIRQILLCIKQNDSLESIQTYIALILECYTRWSTANESLVAEIKRYELPALAKLFTELPNNLNAPQRLHQPASRITAKNEKKNDQSDLPKVCCTLQ